LPELQPEETTLLYPDTLADVYGRSASWALSGAFISITGRRMDSSKSSNYLASITEEARRGDRRIRVRWLPPEHQLLAREVLLCS
jgi:hypothetical protein